MSVHRRVSGSACVSVRWCLGGCIGGSICVSFRRRVSGGACVGVRRRLGRRVSGSVCVRVCRCICRSNGRSESWKCTIYDFLPGAVADTRVVATPMIPLALDLGSSVDTIGTACKYSLLWRAEERLLLSACELHQWRQA